MVGRVISSRLWRQKLEASHLQAVTNIVSNQGFNIETVTRLSGRPVLNGEVDGRNVPVFNLV